MEFCVTRQAMIFEFIERARVVNDIVSSRLNPALVPIKPTLRCSNSWTTSDETGHEQPNCDGRSQVGFSRKRPSAAARHMAA
jgi:hypothetical protein